MFEMDLESMLGGLSSGKWEPKTPTDRCKGLLVAILDRGIRDSISCVTDGCKTSDEVRCEATEWIESSEYVNGGGLTFRYCCEQLDIDSELLRLELGAIRTRIASGDNSGINGVRSCQKTMKRRCILVKSSN